MQLKRLTGHTQKTTWTTLHKLRKCMKCENKGIFGGDVEIDENYIGGKNKNHHANKKTKDSQVEVLKIKFLFSVCFKEMINELLLMLYHSKSCLFIIIGLLLSRKRAWL